MKAMIRSTLGASLAMLVMMLHFLQVDIWKTTSALGRDQPVVTLRAFFALATCYSDSTSRNRPKAVLGIVRDTLLYS